MLALTAAAVILAVVGIKSFLDYKVAELEKIHGPKPAETAADAADPITPPPPNASTPPAPPVAPETALADAGAPGQNAIDQLPRSVLPPIPTELLGDGAGTPPGEPEPLPRPAASPDPATQSEIEALRRENAMYQERLNQLRSGQSVTPSPAAGAPSIATSAAPESPAAPLDSFPGGPPAFGPVTGAVPPPAIPGTGGLPDPAGAPAAASPSQTAAEVAAMAEQVSRQPALAKVIEYDAEWAILVLSGGSENNISVEMRLAVRRGTEILGFIKVTEVEANQSIAELMSPNKFSPTARKPQPGDDIIAFNLF